MTDATPQSVTERYGIHTYLIRAGDTEAVKIGLATNPRARVVELQTANHEALRIIRIIGGNVELAMHHQFKDRRIRGEWFRFCDEMLTWLPGPEEDAELLAEYRRALNMPEPRPHKTLYLAAVA